MSVYRGYVQTLTASSVKSASGNSGTLNLGLLGGGSPDAGQFILNVTASSAPTTLNVYLQHSPDSGATWFDFGQFAQVGAVATNVQALTWDRRSNATVAASTGNVNTGDTLLTAATVINGPIADNFFRVKWILAGTSYTFSVIACLDKD